MSQLEATRRASQVGGISPIEIRVASDRRLCHQDTACQGSQAWHLTGTHEGHVLRFLRKCSPCGSTLLFCLFVFFTNDHFQEGNCIKTKQTKQKSIIKVITVEHDLYSLGPWAVATRGAVVQSYLPKATLIYLVSWRPAQATGNPV